MALTCGHIADNIINADAINRRYQEIRRERDSFGTKIDGRYKKQVAALETKYNLVKTETIISIQMQQTPHRFETEEEGPVDFRSVLIKTDNEGNATHIERLDQRLEANGKTNKID